MRTHTHSHNKSNTLPRYDCNFTIRSILGCCKKLTQVSEEGERKSNAVAAAAGASASLTFVGVHRESRLACRRNLGLFRSPGHWGRPEEGGRVLRRPCTTGRLYSTNQTQNLILKIRPNHLISVKIMAKLQCPLEGKVNYCRARPSQCWKSVWHARLVECLGPFIIILDLLFQSTGACEYEQADPSSNERGVKDSHWHEGASC